MTEKTTGWRAVLSTPWVYELAQKLVGARRGMKFVVDCYIAPRPGESLLDIGCGPGGLVPLLPDVRYVGFDHSAAYVAEAQATHGHRGTFICGDVSEFADYAESAFDIAVAYGVLHHLDDAQVAGLFATAHRALKPGGRMVTADPCYFAGQDPITRFVSSRDRGQNVRTVPRYLELARQSFPDANAVIMHGYLPFPYAACVMSMHRAA